MVLRAFAIALALTGAVAASSLAGASAATVEASAVSRDDDERRVIDGRQTPVQAAPAAVSVGPLTFSESVDDASRPVNSQSDFSAYVVTVWTSFDYTGFTDGTRMSALVRANGEDFGTADLKCCPSSSGRFTFPIERPGGDELGGAAYQVLIYAGDVEVAQGGFGVRGTQRFDDDDDDDDDDDS